ncbi:hypothetical protein [Kamptonema sp. UHCC 0994]|uniref:hypothetical protein n=1 Tax=Kamptonema sp. UHCC 0994 TaxID=3031329 RepID=UPI0023BA2097|nr:hypothetical protein [Kamptonema sp. UHCC 0994]MDF0552547.1 hypothetical protein [Kamptonema sp. UHCC 0994]
MEHTTLNQSNKQTQQQTAISEITNAVLAQLNPDYEIACRQINTPTNSLEYIKFKDFPAEHQEGIRRGLESIAQGNSISMEEFKSEKQSS